MFQVEIGKLEPTEREDVMEIVTSWMERGMERGIERGMEQGLQRERELVLRLLTRRVGELSQQARSHIEALSIIQMESLAEALLDFTEIADLDSWLQANQ